MPWLSAEIARLAVALDEVDSTTLRLSRYIELSDTVEWVKYLSLDGWRMLAVSQGYADAFLDGDPTHYRGMLDREIWPAEAAKTFAKNDNEATRSLEEWQASEEPLSGGRVFLAEKMAFKAGDRLYCKGRGVLK